MSLINDALKRARLGQKKSDDSPPDSPPETPPETPPDTPPLEPVESDSTPKRSPKVLMVLCILLLGCGLWFVWKWWNSPAQPVLPELAQTTVTNAAPASSDTQVPPVELAETTTNEVEASVADATPVLSETNAIMALEDSEPVSPPVETNVQEIVAAPPPEPTEPPIVLQPSRRVTFPPLKLQGIFFRMKNPSVLINNLTLFIGDKVAGVSVVEIHRTKVTLELNGARKELFLK